MILKGWLCKLMEWRVQGPSREHLAATEETIRGANPKNGVDALVKHLTRDERLAVFSKFRLLSLPAGRTVASAGDNPQDLHIVVSGMLKEGGAGQRPQRSPPATLKEGDFFGFGGLAAQPPGDHPDIDIISITRVELVKISADHLSSTFRSHPNALKKFRLFSHATGSRRPVGPETARKGARYPAQTVMVFRISPLQAHESPLVLTGVLYEVSVGGLCFVPDADRVPGMSSDLMNNAQTFVGRRGIVKVLAEGISLQVPGQIARTGHVVVDGAHLPCFEISLKGLSSLARWVFLTLVTHATVNPPLPERRANGH
jgi:CRP-like cAMP-binding protein